MMNRITLITSLISLLYSISVVIALNMQQNSTLLGWMILSFWGMVIYLLVLLFCALGCFLLKKFTAGKNYLWGLLGSIVVYITVMILATIMH